MICPNCGQENENRSVCSQCGQFLASTGSKKAKLSPSEAKAQRLKQIRYFFKEFLSSTLVLILAFFLLSILFLFLYRFVISKIDIPNVDAPEQMSVDQSSSGDYAEKPELITE
ncbi:MAG: hypothetical protein Q4P72_00020 [Eubacteriales bacterium]|nr:hypothetical protein [Eubacteriales bacterium]